MALDYSNLGDRAANAKENINKPADPMEEGDFKCVLRSGEFTKSRAGNDMFVLKMKVVDPDASERMAGETLLIRFVITPNTGHQLDRFLDILNSWGANVSTVKKDDDWEDLFIDLVAARPKAIVEIEQSPSKPDDEGKIRMYYEFYWKEVIRCLNIDDLDGLEAPAEEPEAAPEKPAPKKKAAPKKEETKATDTADADGDDW
jgi:hypothetical protein